MCAVQLMGGERQLVEAVRWLEQNISFDLDKRVHVFELTIRALGKSQFFFCCDDSFSL